MERIRHGHRGSLRILVDRYWSSLVGYAAGFVGGRDPAKDVVQDSFIRLWMKRDDWNSGGSVSAYLYRIVRNLSLNARRDQRTARRHDDLCGVTRAREDPPRRPDEALEAASLRAEVEAAIEALPERRREVFVLSRFHGLTHREIAEAMEISPQTVSNQMTAALAELRSTLCHHLRER
ncbi:MAG: RNA polymerase sigma-70 factor [Gemmatimonadetes bacterium]|nr:RNA polymerase sigma-70 factor [Gemmatimonadota bacterium]NIU32596.1 RNA polymerase sigma-70 factor [Gemmatimonadota bacterium]NIU37051.1 RNA polymerase sigma-70 factor [Gemmatimonadota bacterium]NIW65694.1 RNA polymerase sigma-70 factor [Gemmatimonadota bacterium]NIX41000.1 RNA polymerase sigma-70 factor [Gemmatimonadota bacterium]